MNTTNAVRQVLMNELGLTRHMIQEEMRKIIEAEATKVISSMVSQRSLERLVGEEFRKLVSNGKYDRSGIERICIEAAKKEAETFMRNNLRFVMSNVELTGDK